MNIKRIVSDQKFSPFFWTQFLGAFNDNFFKNALVVLVAFRGVQLLGLDEGSVVAVASGLFILPFFLFSPLAGQIADKYEKSQLVRATKLLEIAVMFLAAVAFLYHSYLLLMGLLFLMGLQSTLFGPVKYSLIPELVDEDALTEGNALIEIGTFLAILLGTIGGGLAASFPSADTFIGVSLLLISILGYWVSCKVLPASQGSPQLKIQWNPAKEYISLWKLLREKPVLFNSVLAISWFWFFGAGVLSVLPIFVKNYLGANESVVTVFLAMFTIGVGLGAVVCERISYKRVEIGVVPIGSLGMTLFLLDLYFVGNPWEGQPNIGISQFVSLVSGWRLLIDFLMMSVFGGVFIVPLYTLLQERSSVATRSRVIAANNIFNALFMVVSSGLILVFYKMNLTTVDILAVLALLNIGVAIYIYFAMPEMTLRFYSWIVSRCIYSVRVKGLENIPHEGPFILAANHVSYVDWLIISGACKRPVSFIMYYKFFKIPFVRNFMKQARVIPIAGAQENPEIMEKAFVLIDEELKQGNPICIFPEGKITYNGELSAFKPGLLRIVKNHPAPVVPVVLHGLWGSVFSRKKPKDKIHRREVLVEFLPPMGAEGFTLQSLEAIISHQLKP